MNVADLFSDTAAEARTMVRARVRKLAADGRVQDRSIASPMMNNKSPIIPWPGEMAQIRP